MELTETVPAVVLDDSNGMGVCWGAVIAGALVAAAAALALLTLGTGIGLSVASPWMSSGSPGERVGLTAIVWLILMQLIAASMGGYLAGRLRSRWANVHTHEVYFRDTAHGFLAWSVGLVVTAAFLTAAAASVAGRAARTNAISTNASGSVAAPAGPNAYFADTLLRSTAPNSNEDAAAMRGEVALIFANGIREGGLPTNDRYYLAQVVAAKTGTSEADAGTRVDDAFSRAQQAAEHARKAIAHLMYWTFLALLVGAFSASLAATIGGRQRDRKIFV